MGQRAHCSSLVRDEGPPPHRILISDCRGLTDAPHSASSSGASSSGSFAGSSLTGPQPSCVRPVLYKGRVAVAVFVSALHCRGLLSGRSSIL